MVRDKGKGRRGNKFISLFLGNPLVPHPSSLNLNTSLGEAKDENKTAVGTGYSASA